MKPVKNHPKPSERLKGKARKEARKDAIPSGSSDPASQTPAYTIPIKEFISLTGFVGAATNPVVKVPLDIALALAWAIKLLKRHHAALN